jgi:D-alanyl-D-alanine carboxypeptidase
MIRSVGLTGVQARVTTPYGNRVATSGVADRVSGRPVPPDGWFRIGSTTKAFVATVLLQLAGEGRLRLTDPVERWLPGLATGGARRMTIREVMQHSAGVYDGDFPSISTAADYYQHRYDIRYPERLVVAAMRHKPDFPPGTAWSYSNTGYLLLGMVIQQVTGRRWYEEVDGRIIRPLGLRHTLWPGSSPHIPLPHADGYERFTAGGPLVDVTELIDADASGGLLSTTADLDRFVRALFGGRLLNRPELAEMLKTVPVDAGTEQIWPGARYGLGLFSRPLSCGGRYWTPSGDQEGYKTRVGVSADGRRSVVISMSTRLSDSLTNALRQEGAANTLIDHAICDVRENA